MMIRGVMIISGEDGNANQHWLEGKSRSQSFFTFLGCVCGHIEQVHGGIAWNGMALAFPACGRRKFLVEIKFCIQRR